MISCFDGPVRTPGHNAPLIRFLILALYVLFACLYRMLPLQKTEWWGAGVVICLERGADLHMAQLMPLPITVSCFGRILIGFIFLLPAHPG